MSDPLRLAGLHAKWLLAAGLVVAILLPGLAQWLSGLLVPLIIIIMFLGALRLRPGDVRAIWQRSTRSIRQVLILQVMLPAGVGVFLWIAGVGQTTGATVLLLMLSAPAIVSSPNMAAILGLDQATAMRLVIWSTVMVPVTSIPVLLFLFGATDVLAVVRAAGNLVLIIALAGGAGIALRALVDHGLTPATEIRFDGVSAIALAVFVIALMPAIGETFAAAPWVMTGWIGLAFAANFGLQIMTLSMLGRHQNTPVSGAYALASGNRNLALFFAALPATQTADFLPFLAAYQIPMYLTPMLLGALYTPRTR